MWLFLFLKFKRAHFKGIEAIKRAVTTELKGIAEESLRKCRDTWQWKMWKYIRSLVDYFEEETLYIYCLALEWIVFDTSLVKLQIQLVIEKKCFLFFSTHDPGCSDAPYIFHLISFLACPVGWGCRIHWPAPLQRGKTPPNECPGYDTKQSDGEVPAMLEIWGMRSTPSLPSLPGPLW